MNPTPSPTPSWSTPSPMPPSVSASTPGRPSFGTMPPLGTPTPVASGTPATVPASRWQAIEKDLAQRGVDATSARVVTAQAVTWNNGALGCPEPGGVYTQALVDGMQVIVDAGGTQYDYRFGNNDSPRLCERR